MTAPRNANFQLASNFILEFDGQQIGSFKSVSGLKVTSETVDVQMTVQGKQVTVKTMGNRKFEPIKLSRVYDGTSTLYTWYNNLTKSFDPMKDKKTGAIYTINSAGDETSRWNFEGGWPSEYDSGELGADKNEVMVESLTISIDYADKIS